MGHPLMPEQVRHAAAEHRRDYPPTRSIRRAARRGDLVVVASEDVARIVCVTEVTETHLVAVLCSNDLDMATDHDVVLRRAGTFDLLLEAECYLVVLPTQVRGVVGSVDLDAVNAVRDNLFTDGESVEGYEIGIPLAGPSDPRWAFMQRELEDVTVLRGPAHAVLFDDGWNPGYRAGRHRDA